MNKFKINDVEYDAAPFTFNTICELEDYGVTLENLRTHRMAALRAYLAISGDMDIDDAGNEIEEHIKKGYSAESLLTALSKEMAESDFFQSLKTPKKRRTKKAEE